METRDHEAQKASHAMDEDGGPNSDKTHDCADDLAPLALPPDLPPVILMGFG